MGSKKANVKAIFCAAIEKESSAERSAYVDEACRGDRQLRADVEALLKAHYEGKSLLDKPVLGPDVTLGDSPVTEGPGTIIGRYKLLEMIGEGGMGLVYLAEQKEPVRRQVALKIIKPGMDSRHVIARFEAEQQTLALLDHHNIARVLDAGTTDTGRPYFVMEYVKGMPITKYCDRHKLNIEQRLKLFLRVCEAVHHAHQKGIIHRDIKPFNILISVQDDRAVPKIIDFGIAKAITQPLTEETLFTRQGQLLGTPEYMSPEQADMGNQDIDTRADIYSLGVVLYELLSGALPFEHEVLERVGFAEVQRILQEEEPPRPSLRLTALGEEAKEIAERRRTQVVTLARRLHRELEWIPLKAMRKDRSRRYRSASELADDIQNYLNGAPLIAGPETATYRVRKFVSKHAGSVATAILVAAALVIGLCLATVGFAQASRQRNRAAVNFQRAREAVNEMTRVAEEELANVPEMKEIQKQLLQKAQVFYAGFLEENADDRTVREEIGQAYLRLGGIHRTLGQHAEAEDAFENAIDIFEEMVTEYPEVSSYRQDLADGYGRLAEVLTRTERLKAAEQAVRQQEQLFMDLATEFPSSAEHQLNLAGCHCELGRLLWLLGALDEAEQILRQETNLLENLVIEYPDTTGVLANCYFTLGHVLGYANRHEESVQFFQRGADLQKKLVEDFPRDTINKQELAQNMVSLGMTMNIAGRTKEAEVVLREAADLCQELGVEFPKSGWEWAMGEAYHHLSEALNKTGRHEEAEQALRQALEIKEKLAGEFPDVPVYRFDVAAAELFHLAATFLMAGRMEQWEQFLGESLELHEEVVAECPENAWYRQDLVNTYRHQGSVLSGANRQEEAAHAFQRALELQEELVVKFPRTLCYKQDRANIFAELGQVLERSGRWEEAEEVYQKAFLEYTKAIELDPNDAGHWEARGRLCMDMERWDEALADFFNAIELDANNPDHWQSRAVAYQRLGQWDKAIADYSKAIEVDPNNPAPWHERGWSYWNMEKWDEAIADLSEAIELDPSPSEFWHWRGETYWRMRQWDEALADLSEAILLSPQRAWHWHIRGAVYSDMEKWDEAIADLSKAIEVASADVADPESRGRLAEVYRNLGDVLEKIGRLDEAQQAYQEAEEIEKEVEKEK